MSPNEDEPQKPKNPYSKTLHEYASASTAHGIAYVFEDGRLFFERVLWVIVVIAALTFAIIMSKTAYYNWKDNPVLTSVKTTGLPIENIDFPSITVCTQGAANEVVDAALFQQFNDYLIEKGKRFEALSISEQIQEGQTFLMDMYPGAKAPPNQLVSMMASPGIDADRGLEAITIFNPEDKKTCSVNVDGDLNPLPNQKSVIKRNAEEVAETECPSGFKNKGNGACWHYGDHKMTYKAAGSYCTKKSTNSVLLQLENDFEDIFDQPTEGKIVLI